MGVEIANLNQIPDLSALDAVLPPFEGRESRRRRLPDAADFYTGQTPPRLPYCMPSLLKDAFNDAWRELSLGWINTGAESMVYAVRPRSEFVIKFIPGLSETARTLLATKNAEKNTLEMVDPDLLDRLCLLSARSVHDYDVGLWTDSSAYTREILPDQFAISRSPIGRAFMEDVGLMVPQPVAWSILPHPSGLLEFYVYLQRQVHPPKGNNTPVPPASREDLAVRLRSSPVALDLTQDKNNLVAAIDGLYYVDMIRRHPGDTSLENLAFFAEARAQCEVPDGGYLPVERLLEMIKVA